MIPFNRPPHTGNEEQYIAAVLGGGELAGNNGFGHKCERHFEQTTGCEKALLTPSCTLALELAALLLDIRPGDEVIMPSYTFTSTANAFVLRGARIVFVDVHPATMNIDERLIEPAISARTRAIVPVHYAGVACAMDAIMAIARRHDLVVIEDAAQGVMSHYQNRPLGSIGHLGAYSFHATKNLTSGGEGGLLLINDKRYCERAEILREKGTNRSQFLRGMVDKYSWVDVGSSYLLSELQAACLWGQLEAAAEIQASRQHTWQAYREGLQPLVETGRIAAPHTPEDCRHNAHMFYIKVADMAERSALMACLESKGVASAFHFVPLHTAPVGRRFGRFAGKDVHTLRESERLLRLPLWFGMQAAEREQVIDSVLACCRSV